MVVGVPRRLPVTRMPPATIERKQQHDEAHIFGKRRMDEAASEVTAPYAIASGGDVATLQARQFSVVMMPGFANSKGRAAMVKECRRAAPTAAQRRAVSVAASAVPGKISRR